VNGAFIQERAAAFGENFEAERSALRAGPGASEGQE